MAADKRPNSTGKPAAASSSSSSKPSSGSGSKAKNYYPPTDTKSGASSSSSSKSRNNGKDVHLSPSSKLKLLHQRTSLSLAYDRERGWGYQGETAMYLIANTNSSTSNAQQQNNGKDSKNGNVESSSSPSSNVLGSDDKPIELALHMRDGCRVDSVDIYGVASRKIVTTSNTTTNNTKDNDNKYTGDDKDKDDNGDGDVEMEDAEKKKKKAIAKIITIHQLQPLPHHEVSFAHHDPLSIVCRRPAKLHCVEDDGNVHFDKSKGGAGAASSNNGNNWQAPPPSPRCEADAHAARGIKGMTYSLRAASISSAAGELKITISPNNNNDNKPEANKNNLQFPKSEAEAIQCWKDDLIFNNAPPSANSDNNEHDDAAGEIPRGTMECKMNKDMSRWRCKSRREARLDAIAKSLGGATAVPDNSKSSSNNNASKNKWPLSPAMKIVVRFSLRLSRASTATNAPNNNIHYNRLNLGGIHFLAPPPKGSPAIMHPSVSTPHAHTVVGSHGDHQGVRSWLPTLDSASPLHRASHELVVKVTARSNEGLWPSASGEDFGANRSVCHPVLGNDADESIFGPLKEEHRRDDDSGYQKSVVEAERAWNAVQRSIDNALGRRHAGFVNDFFYGAKNDNDGPETASDSPLVSASKDGPDFSVSEQLNPQMLSQIRHLQPTYVTSIFSSLMWSPCPSRSLGFAVGPFSTLHDPEYFRLDDDDDSDSDGEDANNGEDGGQLSLQETARRLGEGIRQLFFAPKDDRKWIHDGVSDEAVFGGFDNLCESAGCARHERPKRPELTPSQLQTKRLLEKSILASTIGVPNRALSLMRDVLALPAYRTSSYTQIWIPNAHMSGSNSGGNMVGSPEVCGCNSFLGGAILDSALLPPLGMRLPYYHEGRTLQFLQARNAIRGWIRAALPLGGVDDVGQGYLHVMVETFVMSLYERGHGAFGEGGGRGSFFYTKRYAIGSGLNSPNLDFLPLVNVEDDDLVVDGGGLGAIAIEERGKEHLWRSATNGTETHTSSLDEYVIGQLLAKDYVESLERQEKSVSLPSMGWTGSYQSATFLSHNSASSTSLGSGATDFVHPMGGQMYRAAKTVLLNRVYEGRSGISHYTRVVRASFIASFLNDIGVSKLKLPEEEKSSDSDKDATLPAARPPFVVCIDEIIKKQALSHAIFTRALRVMSGPIHEAYLRGNLVDIGRENYDTRFERKLVTPEGFPNSYVRGASGLYMRVGVHIEAADGSASSQSTSVSQSAAAVKGIHLHVVAEPVIPDGGSAFGGPVTLRVIENEGQCREFVKNIPEDGSRIEWGPVFLHARPVSTAKQQQAASGISEAPSSTTTTGSAAASGASGAVAGASDSSTSAFTSDHLHRGGYQALELMRITNITPLLWVRVDPHGLYNGRLHIFQQDACLAEQLFHDGDAAGQVEAMRALAERPLKVQGVPKINNVHDVPIPELPVRVLGDCLRGSVALHCDLPHNPAVRAQAALAIAQWQNNKAPESRDVVGGSAWLGLDLLLQYFTERYYCNGVVLPINFRRCVLHKHIAGGGATSGGDTTSDGGYQYLDALSEKDDRKNAIEFADEIEIEEDEEYRVRGACVTAIASIRAQDGTTPKRVVSFLEDVLLSGDKAAVGSLLLPKEEEQLKKKQDQALDDEVAGRRIIGPNDEDVANLPYVSLSLVAEALLALCYIHVRPQSADFESGARPIIPKAEDHPIIPLMELCLGWLEWDLIRMRFRSAEDGADNDLTGVGDACRATIAPCAITALCHLALLKQSTTSSATVANSSSVGRADGISPSGTKRKTEENNDLDKTTTAQFYIELFDDPSTARADAIRAAAAQSAVCVCCAADRIEVEKTEPLGLLVSLEFMLDRILEPTTSPGLRLTLALLMMDACTGKICSLQRTGSFCRQTKLCAAGTRFMNGPLGASCGGDNGSALLVTVSDMTYPAANAVNDGARRGLRLLKDNCKAGEYSRVTVVRVAKLATRLWRTINGEVVLPSTNEESSCGEAVGVCAHDTPLRCTLLALWQWIWPRQCHQFMKVNAWHAMEGTPQYYAMGLNHVMKTTSEEKNEGAYLDEVALAPLGKVVDAEIDRQRWRGEMAGKAYRYFKMSKDNVNLADAGQPLPVVEKDPAWKVGGWVASTAQQRRNQGADGGSAVSKIRLNVKNSSTVGDNS